MILMQQQRNMDRYDLLYYFLWHQTMADRNKTMKYKKKGKQGKNFLKRNGTQDVKNTNFQKGTHYLMKQIYFKIHKLFHDPGHKTIPMDKCKIDKCKMDKCKIDKCK